MPDACATAYSSSAVLPMPASPVITSASLVPRRALARSRSIWASSAPRPITMPRSYGPPPLPR